MANDGYLHGEIMVLILAFSKSGTPEMNGLLLINSNEWFITNT